MTKSALARLAALVLSCAAVAGAQAAATITIVNQNAPGVGFNDPTPATPVGANPGTTLGQQRLIAFQHAADIWGATLTSNVPIRIGASFVPLSCTADSAVLGSAGANEIWSDFPNAPRAATWYPSALASKIAGVDVSTPGEPHIIARFNSRLGLFPDCLPGPGFYLGLDNKHGDGLDLVTVLLHEMAHGLGFQTFTDDETGAEILDLPSIWDHYLVDNRSERVWADLTPEQRVASAISVNGLSWNGPAVTAAVPQVLDPRSRLTVVRQGGRQSVRPLPGRRRLLRPAARQETRRRTADAGHRPARPQRPGLRAAQQAATRAPCAATSPWSRAAPALSPTRRRTSRRPARSA